MNNYGLDTFIRGNQSGLGNASDGQSWSQVNGAMTASIISNKGHLTGQNSDSLFKLGSKTFADGELSLRFKCTNHGNDIFGPAWRIVDGNNWYSLRAFNNVFAIRKMVASSVSVIASVAFTLTNGQDYWMRARSAGTSHYAKIWADGTIEPPAWMLSVVDTSFQNSGNFGAQAWTSSATDVFDFDNYLAVDSPTSDVSDISETLALVPLETILDASASIDTPSLTATPSIIDISAPIETATVIAIGNHAVPFNATLPNSSFHAEIPNSSFHAEIL